MKRKTLFFILLGAFVLRLIVAFTYLRPTHPDELYQGIELAHLLRTGSGSEVMDVLFHLRNLTMAFVYKSIHHFLGFISLDTPSWRIISPRIFIACLDMSILWAVYRRLKKATVREPWVHVVVLATFAFASFALRDAPTTTLEHTSAIFMWLSIGFMAMPVRRRYLFLAGLCAALVAVVRYPSALFTLGFVAAIALQTLRAKTLPKTALLATVAGLLTGIAIGGLADWCIYGRPYESAWMYLQFNVFSGLGAYKFGTAPVWIYADFFKTRFGSELLLITVIAIPGALRRFWQDLKSFDVMATGMVVYFVGHLFPAHREVRFMIPIGGFCLWYLTLGFLEMLRSQNSIVRWLRKRPRLAWSLLIFLVIIPNTVRVFMVLRGDFARNRMTYYQVVDSNWPQDVCALVSGISVPSTAYPAAPKNIGVQRIPAEIEFTQMHLETVAWLRDPSECFVGGKYVFLVHAKISKDLQSRCHKTTDLNTYTKLVDMFSKKAVLWKCSVGGLLDLDSRVADRRIPLLHEFPHLSELPPIGLKDIALEEFVRRVAK